jgi:hypothetical protein
MLYLLSTLALSAQVITTASGVRVRSEPQKTAKETVKLGIGVILDVVKDAPGGWLEVKPSEGPGGFVFGALTAVFDRAQRNALYLRIMGERLAAPKLLPEEARDLADFAHRAALDAEAKDKDAAAELALDDLLALQKALDAIDPTQSGDAAIQRWVKKHEDRCTFNDPAGTWMVGADEYWEVHDRFKGSKLSERIAWQAAQAGMPGECEGALTCYVGRFEILYGRFLAQYPNGEHAAEALERVSEAAKGWLPLVKDPELADEDKADLQEAFGKLRAAAVKSKASGELVKQLDQLIKAVKPKPAAKKKP